MVDGVSVVLATYNGERFLGDQLQSLAGQQFLPAELIVSDDGSSDATVSLVKDFARSAPFPVRILSNAERLGYGANFLQATALAQGDLVAFCDQDDVWYPQKLQRCVDVLRQSGAALLVHRADVITASGEVRGHFDQGIERDVLVEPLRLAPWVVFYGCTMVFRRDLFELVDVASRGAHTFEHNSLLSHDLWITFLASSLGRVVMLRERLIGYRQHGGNVTPSIAAMSFQRFTSSLGLAADPVLARDRTASHRAELLEELAGARTVAPEVRRQATEAARYWTQIAALERQRLIIYGNASFPSRLLALGRLVLAGGYRSAAAQGLGSRLVVKDVLAGALRIRRSQPTAEPDQRSVT